MFLFLKMQYLSVLWINFFQYSYDCSTQVVILHVFLTQGTFVDTNLCLSENTKS